MDTTTNYWGGPTDVSRETSTGPLPQDTNTHTYNGGMDNMNSNDNLTELVRQLVTLITQQVTEAVEATVESMVEDKVESATSDLTDGYEFSRAVESIVEETLRNSTWSVSYEG